MVLAFTIITAFGFLMVGLMVSSVVGDYLIAEKTEEKQQEVTILAGQISTFFYDEETEQLQEMLKTRGEELNGRFIVLDNNSLVQSDSLALLNAQEINTNEITQVMDGTSDSAYGFHQMQVTAEDGSIEKEWVVYYAVPIVNNSQRIGVLFYSSSIQNVIDKVSQIGYRLVLVFVFVTIIVFLLCYEFAKWTTKPIANMTEAIYEMSKGRFNMRVRSSGTNEMRQLSDTFNMMSEKMENLDRLRNEFVSNASHELKTPLSTIKILVESILYQDEFDKEITTEFLQDINSEIDRMSTVISDLLILVQIDQYDTMLKKERVSLNDLVRKAAHSLSPIVQNKEITINLTAKEEIFAYVDKIKLSQAVYNLIENAIKYSEEGIVTVALNKNAKSITISVSDTGIGIPPEDISHIFERFYRVDKARSRGTGGTGLGLSIVQRVVMLHGGKISVTSKEGVGTTFTIELPIDENSEPKE